MFVSTTSASCKNVPVAQALISKFAKDAVSVDGKVVFKSITIPAGIINCGGSSGSRPCMVKVKVVLVPPIRISPLLKKYDPRL